MGRLEKTTIAVIAVIIIILIAAFLLQRSLVQEAPIYRVSVLVDGATDQYWKSFWLGLDNAAQIHNVDMHYLSTAYDPITGTSSHDQQVAAVLREIESGTNAIVLAPADAHAMSAWLDTQAINVPVIVVGTSMESHAVAASIGVDDFAVVERLAGILSEMTRQQHEQVVIFHAAQMGTYAQFYYESLTTLLIDLNIFHTTVSTPLESYSDVHEFLLSYSNCVFVGLQEQTLELLSASLSPHENNNTIVGIGYTNAILDALNRETVYCLVVQSRFDIGYLSMEYAINAITGTWVEDTTIAIHVATKENMYTEPMEHILFPVAV